MNKVSDEQESFAASDLILAQPIISANLALKKPAIGGGDSLFKLFEQPAISDNLMPMLIHYLIPPDLNRNNEK